MRTLTEAREAMGLSQRSMAQLLGTTVPSYCRWERQGLPGGRLDLALVIDLLRELPDAQLYSVGIRFRTEAESGGGRGVARVRAALQLLAAWPEAMVRPTEFGPWADIATQVVEPDVEPAADSLDTRWREDCELDPAVAVRLDVAEATLRTWSVWLDAPVPHLVCDEGRAARAAHEDWRQRYGSEDGG